MLLLFLCLYFNVVSLATSNSELVQIELTCNYSGQNAGIIRPRPRTPANPPVVYQNGYTIMWMTPDFCHSIVLINPDDEEIVYETTVSENDTQIVLPAWLEGQYEIRFMRDTYYYYGTIEL